VFGDSEVNVPVLVSPKYGETKSGAHSHVWYEPFAARLAPRLSKRQIIYLKALTAAASSSFTSKTV
jgi:hypothetical protein